MSRKHDNPRAFDLAFSHWCWNWRAELRANPASSAETGLKRTAPICRKTRLSAFAIWLENWIFTRPPSPARQEALEAFFVSLGEAAKAGDRAAYTDLFLPDATVFLPSRPPLLGRDQIGDWFDTYRQSVVLRLDSYRQEQISVVGAVAMIRSRGAELRFDVSRDRLIGFELQRRVDVHVSYDHLLAVLQ